MLRLRLLLVVSHLCLARGWLGLYLGPDWSAAALIALGAFVRWMVPSAAHPQVEKKQPIPFFISYGLTLLLISWLVDLGIGELIAKGWSDRFSPRPIALVLIFGVWLALKDWLYFVKLTPAEIDVFYTRKT